MTTTTTTTTTTTNWPDPNRPGVPLFPERDGWHWLSYGPNQEPVPFEWSSEEFSDAPTEWAWGTEDGPEEAHEMARHFCYHGPCITPTQIAEMLAAERDRIKNIIRRACNLGNIITPRQRDMIIAGVNSETAIRNLGDAP